MGDPTLPRNAIVIGGTKGLGLAIAEKLAVDGNYKRVVACGRSKIDPSFSKRASLHEVELRHVDVTDRTWIHDFDVSGFDTVIYCAGFGKLKPFSEVPEDELYNLAQVNALSLTQLIRKCSLHLAGPNDFKFVAITSISSLVVSPLFAAYAAAKAFAHSYIESVNVELEMSGSKNLILEVIPGYIEATSFYGGPTKIEALGDYAIQIISAMKRGDRRIILDYEKTYRGVLDRYAKDPKSFGQESYNYKMERMKS
ncbi:hypothetical protein HYN69_18345 (plasmid) [Gemmobacter aquarius]|uniref:Ketoreductase domain-containing protein n=1 Tax=Paragemmobacter aquarius TaxID=2169400 RepID=A0A2S0URX2_9RHOB|nr:SDR family oxidoreductase [Gemmobacter aquarius]AWB50566.1 hypothetical protein HYN69_18345 [Gemmobacter aquarius]